MKKKLWTILLFVLLVQQSIYAQSVNWRGIDSGSAKHLVSAEIGADYSFYYGLAYGYVLKNKWLPVVAGAEITLPIGAQVFDDWRGRISLQSEVWKTSSLSLSVMASGVLRRYGSQVARMYNTGADLTLTFGYVKPKWGIVALAGYEKSIATHIQHGTLREYYPEIRDGWYGHAGGNFKFGGRAGFSFGSWNTFLTIGKHYGQDLHDNPTFPFFAEFSIQKGFGK